MTRLRYAWRQFASAPWPALLLALTVALLALIATGTPRLLTNLGDAQLTQRLDSLSAIRGDVTSTWSPNLDTWQSGVDPWPGYRAAAEQVKEAQPEPLRSLLAEPGMVARFTVTNSSTPPTESGYYRVTLSMTVDPDLASTAALDAGDWPAYAPSLDPLSGAPVEVAVPTVVADRMGWKPGDTIGNGLRLSGTFTATDPDAVRWEHVPLGLRYVEIPDPNRGVELQAAAFLAPEVAGGNPNGTSPALQFTLWLSTDTAAVRDGIDVSALGQQLTGMLAKSYPMLQRDSATPQMIKFDSELNQTLTTIVGEQRATTTLVAISAAGPIAVGLALVLLAAQLLVHRRGTAYGLLLARGMPLTELRRLVAVEGFVLAVPAAVVGICAARALIPGPLTLGQAVIGLVVSLAAPAALAIAAGRAVQGGRSDLSARGGRWRSVAEVLVALVSVAALWRLVTASPEEGAGIDLLTTATPVLLAVAACLAALRLYPLPLHLLGRAFQRGRGLTGFLGTARGLRSPAGGLIPVITIILGVTMAVTCATLLGTMSAGTRQATWNQAGSTLNVSGPRITDEAAEKLAAIGSVTSVARLWDGGTKTYRHGDESGRMRLWLADDALVDAYAVWGGTLPSGLFDGGTPPRVLTGGAVDQSSGEGTLESVGEVRVAGHRDALPGALGEGSWLLMGISAWPADQQEPKANIALIATADGADLARVSADIAAVLPTAKIVSAADQLAELESTPTVSGLARIFVVLAACTAVLLLLAIVTSQLMAGDTRRGLVAVLRTLGAQPGTVRGLTAWELGPIVALALVLGFGMGVGLAALLLRAVDFRPVTGGTLSPSLHLDPLIVGGVTGGLILTAALAVTISAWLAGRADVAREMRIGEER